MLLLQPIKDDLHLNDTQLGLITGIAFGLFYATLGIPFGRWSDRGNRVTITSLAIGLWGLTVMACVFVNNYTQLVMARMAAAVGESGCKPPTYSLIGDYFPAPVARIRAMTLYLSGGPISALLGLVVGGWLNEHYGWRMTFFLMGIPGLMLAAVIKLTIAEPRDCEAPRAHERTLPSPGKVLVVLWQQRAFRHLTLALIALYMMGTGMYPWYGAFLVRSHGMNTAELGLWLGLIFGLSGVVGVLTGGYVASRWFADNERGQMRMTALAVATLVPCSITFLTVREKQHALLALVPMIAVINVFQGPSFTLMQRLVPAEMRATAMSVLLLLMNLVAFGVGPQLVGILSDTLMPVIGVESLRYAMLAMSLLSLWSSYHFWQVGRWISC